ncbi:hypothetical protein B0H63DRAFT_453894 [Podospora didyma]|uniref:Heterokaryon incompatibility domain-containing protein n=1 Tax=Podospora didyma TaxID=330526 RepID=A0AAE0KAJ4_9PEZI|nr:hypothetical protein B0H63DRAFT_453894 [Podospora didyma]
MGQPRLHHSPMEAAISKPQYQYPPLGDDETRLLLPYPAQPDAPLRRSLRNLKTIENPSTPYKAVSYSWSEVPGFASVDCDGASFQITQSAYQFLRRLRDPERAEYIWIDGLCLAYDWSADCGLNPTYGNPGENSAFVKYREFVNFATWDLIHNKTTRVLAYASGPEEDSDAGGVPSWVPDWKVKDRPEPLSTYNSFFGFIRSNDRTSRLLLGFDGNPVGNIHTTQTGQSVLEVEGSVIDVVGSLMLQRQGSFPDPGCAPTDARAGDKIGLVKGHGAFYVLRAHGNKHVAVGECYFDGLYEVSDNEVRSLHRERFFLI